MEIENLVLSKLLPGRRLSPWECARLLELQAKHGPERFEAALQHLKPKEADVIAFLSKQLSVDPGLGSTSWFKKRCREHGVSWDIRDIGSLCPQCYPNQRG
jgi:hypothetical protein